ncbi:MAG: ferric reductase-like transmembrane domain-containing protein [Actinomycetota bacterium]|nr:ferric reductase-like transmembrane domain-containing protein [Actinomycetota bacterium]
MDKLWWYTARASGLVAWALLAAGVIWGLLLSGKIVRSRPRPAWVVDLHRFLGAAGLVFVGIHVTTIMLDSYVDFSPLQVLVPLASSWHPVAVAWGIVAAYLMVAVEVTSLLRARLSVRAWRMTHFLSFPVYVSATTHLLSAGTDRHSVVVRVAVLAVTVAVAILAAVRVGSAARPHGGPSTPAPARVRVGA